MNQNKPFSAIESFNESLDQSNCRLSEVVKAPRMNSAGQVKPVPLCRRRPLDILQHKESEQQREDLYDFPSFSNLTLEQRRDLSQTACLIFHAADEVSVTAVDFLRHFDKFHDINVLTGKYEIKMYLGPYETTIEEFVKLPEIACALYPLRLTDKITKKVYNRYRSFINVVKTYPIFAFRFCVIQCFKEVTEDATRIFGAITIQTLCNIFNNQPGIQNFFQEKIYDGQVIKRFGKLSLMEALCCFCSRDIVIRIISNDLTIIRLRNHPDFLIQIIENERVLAEKAADFYKAYVKKNSSRLDWRNLRIDPLDIYYNPDLIFISSYPSLFLDNVYAALHYKKSVQDYPTLYRAIALYINKPPDMCTFPSLTENPDINLLIEMVSPEAFEAVEKWDEEKQKLYIKIANELASKLNELDRDFVVAFIDVFPVKSRLLASFMIWSLKRMARHILLVTEQSDFIDRDEIVKKIQTQFKYNIHEWLEMFGISFEDIFFNPEVYYLLAAILIKRQNGIKLYRNMSSIMRDKSLAIGF
uniref:Ras-GEF domain-containing protein n=1 Tax=Panagrolaimus sp. PS1159 TaxID=55785 RepID=A0AC35FG47_9BILA